MASHDDDCDCYTCKYSVDRLEERIAALEQRQDDANRGIKKKRLLAWSHKVGYGHEIVLMDEDWGGYKDYTRAPWMDQPKEG